MCPRCGTPMVVLEWEGIEADWCPDCRGVWLDAGELEWIGERSGVQAGALTVAVENPRASRAGSRDCPRCAKRMAILVVGASGSSVELDSCPRGHGLWFDAGELERMISLHGEGEEGAVARFLDGMFRFQGRAAKNT